MDVRREVVAPDLIREIAPRHVVVAAEDIIAENPPGFPNAQNGTGTDNLRVSKPGDPTAVELLVFSQQAAVFDHAARQRPLIGGVNAEDMGDVADRGDVGDPEDAGVMEIRHRKPPVAERLFELCKHVVIVVAERSARPVGGEIDPRPE